MNAPRLSSIALFTGSVFTQERDLFETRQSASASASHSENPNATSFSVTSSLVAMKSYLLLRFLIVGQQETQSGWNYEHNHRAYWGELRRQGNNRGIPEEKKL